MIDEADKSKTPDYRCPECRQPLKRRRTRTPDECEMLCGGCGASFDVCDLDTVDMLKKSS
jgi:hypothetical protein